MKGENLLLLDSNVFSYCTAGFYIKVLCHQSNASANLIKLIHLFGHSVIRHNDAKNMTPHLLLNVSSFLKNVSNVLDNKNRRL